MNSEDIEPDSHTIARNIATEAMELNDYEVIPSYYLSIKVTMGNPSTRQFALPDLKDEYYHETDIRCKKEFDNGLSEEIYIEIGNEDDWDTRHSSGNSSKYVHKKQVGADSKFENWLQMIKPDAIVIRPSKGELIAMAGDHIAVYNYLTNLKKKYIGDVIVEAEAIRRHKKQIEKSSTKF